MKYAAYTFFLALFLSSSLVPVLARMAPKLGLIDFPDQRKRHHRPIPRSGGIGILIGILLPVLLWVPMRQDIQGYLIAVMVLSLFMLMDDRWGLDYRMKFMAQITAALIVMLYGGVLIHHFPFIPGGLLPTWLAVPFTLLLIVGVTNAVNLSDGLDGLAGGTAILTVSCLGLLAYEAGDLVLTLLALAVIGGTLGFLRYNTNPAWIYMGDTGSQSLGFSAAVIAIIVTQSSNTSLSPVLPLILLGLPILDTLYVIAQRKMAGAPLFTPDRRHIHYRLLDMGLTYYETVVVIYSSQILMVILAYRFAYAWDGFLLGIYGLFCATVIGLLHWLAKRPDYFRSKERHQNRLMSKIVGFARNTGVISRLPHTVIYYILPVLFVVAALLADEVTLDIGLTAWLLVVVLLLSVRYRLPLTRFVIYLTGTVEVYLLATSQTLFESCHYCLLAVYISLAIMVAIWVRYAATHFKFNTLDFIFVFLLMLIPNLKILQHSISGLILIESMIIYYACEVVISRDVQKWTALHSGVATSLVVLGVRGVS